MKCLNLNCDNEALKESGLCLKHEKIESQKINGILYLPALGLIVTLIFTPLLFIGMMSMGQINFQKIGIITNYGIFVILCNLVYYVMAVIAALAFFRKKKITKKLMVTYYIVSFIITACMTVLSATLFNLSLNKVAIGAIGSEIVGLVVWIPYFLLSKRVPVVFHK